MKPGEKGTDLSSRGSVLPHSLQRSLRARIAFYVCTVLVFVAIFIQLVTLFGLPYSGYHGMVGQIERNSAERLSTIAHIESEHLRHVFDNWQSQLQHLQETPAFQAFLASHDVNIAEDLRALRAADESISDLYVIDRKEMTVLCTSRKAPQQALTPKQRAFVATIQESGTLYVSAPVCDSPGRKAWAWAGCRVTQNDRDLILVQELKLKEAFGAIVSHGAMGKTGEVILFSSDCRLLSEPRGMLPNGDRPRIYHDKLNCSAAQEAVHGMSDARKLLDYRNEEVLAAFRPIPVSPDRNWGLVAKQDFAELHAPVLRQAGYSVVVGLIALAVVLILILMLTNRALQPVADLSAAAIRVKNGDYDAHVEPARNDEIGELTQVFNLMVDRVRTSHDLLAAQVEEKTKQLREREQLLRAVCQAAESVSLITTDIAGVDSVIKTFNSGAEQLFGYTAEEAIGMPVARLHLSEDVLKFPKIQDKLHEHKLGFSGELTLVRKSGELFPAMFTVHPLQNGEGKVIGSVGVSIDLTEQRELEERLRQAEKMQAIGHLAGGVAHDFNNQLSAIMGAADLLKLRINDPKQDDLVERIITSSVRAGDLVGQLLAFSRKGKYLSVNVDIHESINEVVSMLRHSIDKRIEIETEFEADPSITVGDPTQLQNAVLNLGINARDAMPDGGKLIFRTSNTMVAKRGRDQNQLKPGPYIRIQVEDTGCGIPREIRDRIFEPFFTTKERGKGTGMGLAAVYGTIRNHKGAITVKDSPDAGSLFNLLLPLTTKEEEQVQREKTEEFDHAFGRLLLVEDEDIVRENIAEMLTELGYLVTECRNGREAVDFYKEHASNIDLVVLDMVMPEMNGLEAFAHMKEINPDVKALVATGYAVESEARDALKEGVVGFLQKPFKMRDLAHKLRNVLKPDKIGKG